MSFSGKYIDFLNRFRWVFFLIWMAIILCGPLTVPIFLAKLDLSFSAPPETRAAIAKGVLKDSFGPVGDLNTDPLIVLVERIDPKNQSHLNVLSGGYTKNFSFALKNRLQNYSALAKDLSVQGYYTVSTGNELVDAEIRENFVNKGENATYLVISYNALQLEKTVQHDLRTNITNVIESFLKRSPQVDARLTGFSVFGADILRGVQDNLENTEKIAFPFALFILGTVVQSFRLLLIPV